MPYLNFLHFSVRENRPNSGILIFIITVNSICMTFLGKTCFFKKIYICRLVKCKDNITSTDLSFKVRSFILQIVVSVRIENVLSSWGKIRVIVFWSDIGTDCNNVYFNSLVLKSS